MPAPFQAKLIEALEREAEFPPHRLVLDRGRPFDPRTLPEGVELGRRKCCFANAWRVAKAGEGELAYVEGYTLHAGMPEWLARHAWCVDRQGRVGDPTWGADRPLPLAYRGIELPLDAAEPYAYEFSVGTLEGVGEELPALLARL
ncbi:MAG: hypothetical protein H0V29_00600 [Thermoleophilaceae bacterium]|nr:hypothetical protein [Thermoleophilaceae bacterium]